MPIRIIEQQNWDEADGPSEVECIHGEKLDALCDLCYQMANRLPIDLSEGQTLAVVTTKTWSPKGDYTQARSCAPIKCEHIWSETVKSGNSIPVQQRCVKCEIYRCQ